MRGGGEPPGPQTLVALKTQNNPAQYTAGKIVDDVYFMLANNDGDGYVIAEDGKVTFNVISGDNAKAWLISLFANQGVTISDVVSDKVVLEVGSTVPNWSNYTKLG